MRTPHRIRLLLLPLLLAAALPAAAQGGGGGGGGAGGSGGGGAAGGGDGGTANGTGSTASSPVANILCPLVLVGVAGVWYVAGRELHRRRLVFVLFLLEDGTAAVPALDEALRSAEFHHPDGRHAVLRRLYGICADNHVLADYCWMDQVRSHGGTALLLAQQQMKRAGIDPSSLKKATPELLAQRVPPGDCALLGAAVELCLDGLEAISPGLTPLAVLNRLGSAPNDYLYFFYGPNPGKRLTREQGEALHARLSEQASKLEPEIG